MFREKPIDQYIFNNNSLYIPHSKLTEINTQYQCGTKVYNIQLYGMGLFFKIRNKNSQFDTFR